MNPDQFKATVRLVPGSAQWQARFYAFNASSGKWNRVMRTTKTSSKRDAKVIAAEYQRFAIRAANVSPESRMTREDVLDTVNYILRLAGQDTVQDTRQWAEYATEWLNLQKERISPRSLESYQGHVRNFSRWLGDEASTLPLKSFTGQLMQAWYSDMLDEGRRPATVNNAVKTLQAVFDRARAEGFTPRNPAELILRQYGKQGVREPFTTKEIATILDHLRATQQHDWLTVALLGLCTGQRLQDCANANRAHFVETGNKWRWHITQGKTKKDLVVPIVGQLATHLPKLLKRLEGFHLAPSLAGRPSGTPSGLSPEFSRILDAAGIQRETTAAAGSKGRSFTNKTFHSFRHTTNSLMANAGLSLDVRQAILGHSAAATNLRYTHMEFDVLANALEKSVAAALIETK